MTFVLCVWFVISRYQDRWITSRSEQVSVDSTQVQTPQSTTEVAAEPQERTTRADGTRERPDARKVETSPNTSNRVSVSADAATERRRRQPAGEPPNQVVKSAESTTAKPPARSGEGKQNVPMNKQQATDNARPSERRRRTAEVASQERPTAPPPFRRPATAEQPASTEKSTSTAPPRMRPAREQDPRLAQTETRNPVQSTTLRKLPSFSIPLQPTAEPAAPDTPLEPFVSRMPGIGEQNASELGGFGDDLTAKDLLDAGFDLAPPMYVQRDSEGTKEPVEPPAQTQEQSNTPPAPPVVESNPTEQTADKSTTSTEATSPPGSPTTPAAETPAGTDTPPAAGTAAASATP
ncbi:MAG: hypothetical protein KDA60_05060 [Planctomycetales bacterium]|nr:hypothetical protein [Planctomycetales bacterium]